MINLEPSASIVKATCIDFKLLSKIVTMCVSDDYDITIKVISTTKPYSFFKTWNNTIGISLSLEKLTLRYVVSTILHEVRHAMQVKHYSSHLFFKYSSYNKYYNSPEEKDARKFEKLTSEVCKIYKNFKIIEEKIITHELNSFSELSDHFD